MRVAHAIAECCATHHVECLFGVLGEGNLEAVDHAVRACGIPYLAANREDSAVAMADGYARVSGRTGVATATMGPAFTNTLTALIEAARARTPLVLLTATAPPGVAHVQEVDQAALSAAAGVLHQPVRSPATLSEDVARAFRAARLERRPVVLDVPYPFLVMEAELDDRAWLADVPVQRPGPDPAAVDAAVDALAAAERPVLLAGRGAVRSQAREVLVALADQVGALLCTSLLGKSYFAGHPFDLGICGSYATRQARHLISEADCIVAVGASVNRWTTDHGSIVGPGTTLVHCELDPGAVRSTVNADVVVVGDATATAGELLDACRRRDVGGSGYRTAEVARLLAGADPGAGHEDRSNGDGLDMRSVVLALNRILPADRNLVVDTGHFTSEPVQVLDVPEPAAFVFALHFGCVGLGLPEAVGAAVARPDRTTVAVVGDGGIMMALSDLDTAVRQGLPLVVVVMNDGALGAEYFNLKLAGLPAGLSVYPRPALAEVMNALGGRGYRIDKLSDLDAAAPALTNPAGPVLLDVKVRRGLMTEWFGQVVAARQEP